MRKVVGMSMGYEPHVKLQETTMRKTDGGPAFPATPTRGVVDEHGNLQPLRHPGMSTRMYAAIQIAAGLRASGRWEGMSHASVAMDAYQLADALIAEEGKND